MVENLMFAGLYFGVVLWVLMSLAGLFIDIFRCHLPEGHRWKPKDTESLWTGPMVIIGGLLIMYWFLWIFTVPLTLLILSIYFAAKAAAQSNIINYDIVKGESNEDS
jgi:hypothetical protein